MSGLIALTPPHRCNGQLAIAAARAGEIGILDLGLSSDAEALCSAIRSVAKHCDKKEWRWGIRWDTWGESERHPSTLIELTEQPWPMLLLAGLECSQTALGSALSAARKVAEQVYIEVHSLEEALDAETAGFDGVIAKGHEAGGRVGRESTFILLQRFHKRLQIPYFAQGGISSDTAASAFLAGASGVVLCEQLWLAVESPFDRNERRIWAGLDGSETVAIEDNDACYRFFSRSNRDLLNAVERACADGSDWQAMLREGMLLNGQRRGSDESRSNELIPLSPDIAFSRSLAAESYNVAGILDAFKERVQTNLRQASDASAFQPGAPLAVELGTEYPILQGPMTRVSDVAPFCRSVADNGALPFLALALMRGDQVRKLLSETQALLGERAWGVGILGFVPAELRKEQLEIINEYRPPFAIIAGGRPSQAQRLEKQGISTFLHVPSPGLLEAYINEGSRKFIFEGRECGGHVGPRTSFVLWQSAIDILSSLEVEDPEEFQIIFAGGIHDSLSAAMVSALAARLTARGMKIGVLMGTAYLFTNEAVQHGAILNGFQQRALECRETVLLKTGVGHESRCVNSAFAGEFREARQSLLRRGTATDEAGQELEKLNLGRLRIASKGVERSFDSEDSDQKGELISVAEDEQQRRGMYMIGQLAALRKKRVSMKSLHQEVSQRGSQRLRKLASRRLPWQESKRRKSRKKDDIAIVGMGGMFPKAPTIRRFWENIVNRVNAIQEVPEERWRPQDFFTAGGLQRDRVYSQWGGFLEEVVFDPMKWLIPPASLPSIDPTQLLALEAASEALTDAGYDHRRARRDRTGVVFAAAGAPDLEVDYIFRTMMRHYLPKVAGISDEDRRKVVDELSEVLPEWTEDSFPGYLRNVIAGRITNRLDLGGPNYVVDAACAASLAAVYSAIEHLRSGAADAMVVGAADITNHPVCYMSFAQTQALSPNGRSRPFDSSADGIALGECVVAVVLKRLADAERDGDKIYAVIKGVGASSDGKHRSLTSPDPPGQQLALKRAYQDAAVSPSGVSLIEAHATGTAVGDASEITSLNQFFTSGRHRRGQIALGSVKSMIGHTKSAAGLASLVKAALAVSQKVLPPTIGVDEPNSQIAVADAPLYVNTETRPWIAENTDQPRRAGISAFGFGGTNFHVVLEEYQGSYHSHFDVDLTPRSAEIVYWSRGSRDEIVDALNDLLERLDFDGTESLAQLAYSICRETASRANGSPSCRLGMVATSLEDLRSKMQRTLQLLIRQPKISDSAGIYYSEQDPIDSSQVCFLYPGQGSQAVNMLRELVVSSRWAGELFTHTNEVFGSCFPKPFTEYIYPPPAFDDSERKRQQFELNETHVAQPALGTTEVVATQLLNRLGIHPGMTAGHSYGEYVALWAAGCLSRDDLLRISAERGRIAAEAIHEAPGAMAAVAAGANETATALKKLGLDVHLANRNSPTQTIIAGPKEAIDGAVKELVRVGVTARNIPIRGAFHTPAMSAAAKKLSKVLDEIKFRKPSLPVSSNTTAQWHQDDPDAIRGLLTRHLVEPVLFEEQIRQLRAEGARLFLEVGPGCVLTRLVDAILGDDDLYIALSLDAPGNTGWTQVAHMLAQSAALGLPIKPLAWFDARGLAEITPDEFLDRLADEKRRKPSDWILTPARAVPASSRSQQKPDPAGQQNSNGRQREETLESDGSEEINPMTPSPSSAFVPFAPQQPHVPLVLQPDCSQSDKMPEEKMNPEPQSSQMADRDRVTIDSQTDLLSMFQNTMTHWLELQTSQSRLMERFLDIQERALFGTASRQSEIPRLPTTLPTTVAPSEQLTQSAAPSEQPTHSAAPSERPTPSAVVASPPVPIPIPVREAPMDPSQPRVVVPENGQLKQSAHAVESLPTSDSAAVPQSNSDTSSPSDRDETDEVPSTERFRRDLLRAVSERTGYPVEVLDEEMSLESGLGIDSIKTVEIFSKLKQYHFYFRAVDEDDEDMLLEFSQLKTLRAIVASYDERRKRFLPPESANTPPRVSGNGHAGKERPATDAEVKRYSVRAVAAPGNESTGEKKKSSREMT